jgi:MFS family permease
MRETIVSLAALFLSTFILLLGSGLLGTMLSLKMNAADYSDLLIGLTMAGFYIGMMVGGLSCYRIVRRVGHIRAFAAFAAMSCAAIMAHALWMNAGFWFGLRVLNGLTMMGMYIVIESWLNERAEPGIRGRVFSLYMIVSFLGLGLGQFLLNVGDIDGKDLYFVAGLLFALCLVPVALARTAHPQAPQGARTRLRHLMRLAPYGIGGCLAAGLVFGGFYALGAVYAVNIGLGAPGVSLFMGVTILSGLLFQWPVGHLSDNHDRLSVLSLLLAAVGVVCLAIAVLGGQGLIWLLVLAGLFGGLGATLYPVAVAHVTDHVIPHQLVATSATLLKVYGVGATLGPVGAAGVMHVLGPEGLYMFGALVCGLTAFAISLRRRRVAVPVEDQEPFVPMPRAAAGVIAELDPRAETEATEDWAAEEEHTTSDEAAR